MTIMSLVLLFLFLFLFLFSSTLTAAPSPAAAPLLQGTAASPAPAGAGPPNVISILNKDGRFTVFAKLLQSTKVDASLDSQLVDSNNGLTVFAPTDLAFSNLKTGTLNSFTDEQKMELVRFHVLPTHISASQFETVSNPISTQAGGSPDLLAMNVTAAGSSVNITTGETNTTALELIVFKREIIGVVGVVATVTRRKATVRVVLGLDVRSRQMKFLCKSICQSMVVFLNCRCADAKEK
ncbi:fasciclin-like arabinogalactan protein 12 [Salvia hispanica]|uniref:fasciclin-like arabinogalactan protein 12 n=1 Tax=Salvia hispanica TaxID=49212 RepID=UPI002009C0B6|nr:fasciclin-like arabinogalactan protein 12 [Salvia hispanica]